MSESTTRREAPAARPGPGRPPTPRLVPLDTIILLPKTMRPRTHESEEQIERYRHDMDNGDAFPPVVVYKGKAGEFSGLGLHPVSGQVAAIEEDDHVHVLADGYHRLAAVVARIGDVRSSTVEIRAIVKMGTWRDAQWDAFGSNHLHGVPLTNADKRRIVTLILADKEWARRSARAIAEHCHVSSTLVDQVKKERAATTAKDGQSDKIIDKRGRTMQTKNIGQTKKTIRVTGNVGDDESKATVAESATSDVWIERLKRVIRDAHAALGDVGWNRFVHEARALIGTGG